MFIVLTVDEGGEETVREVLGDAGMLTRSVAFGFPEGGLSLFVGIGAQLWDRLYPRSSSGGAPSWSSPGVARSRCSSPTVASRPSSRTVKA